MPGAGNLISFPGASEAKELRKETIGPGEMAQRLRALTVLTRGSGFNPQ